jgi:type I restriction enzyme R subunit
LTAARLILEDKTRFQNATVILVVDRTELEGQHTGWVEKLLGETQSQDIPVWRANSKTEVQDLLKTDKRGLIISMIHKFEGIDKDANTRENAHVFIDEAHRSVAKGLGTYMMAAVPNATIIGVTAHPSPRRRRAKALSRSSAPRTSRAISTNTRSVSRSRTKPRSPFATPWRRAR